MYTTHCFVGASRQKRKRTIQSLRCFVEMVFLYSSIVRIVWQYTAFWNKCCLFMLKLQIEFLNVNLRLPQLPVWMVPTGSLSGSGTFRFKTEWLAPFSFVRDFSGHLIRSLKIGFSIINAIILCVNWISNFTETSAERKNTNFTQDVCMRIAQLEF